MDTEKFNTYASMVFVELSFSSKQFVNEITTKFPDLSEVFIKLVSSVGDESQTHLLNLYTHNKDTLEPFLHDYLKNNEGTFNWTSFLDKYEVTRVAGKFFKIEKTETAYMEFVKTMQRDRWAFSHMSVLSEADTYTIFFA